MSLKETCDFKARFVVDGHIKRVKTTSIEKGSTIAFEKKSLLFQKCDKSDEE